MNFMIPKNYKFKPKILGLIDYQAAVVDAVWAGLLYIIVNLLFSTIQMKLYIFIGLFLPMLLFSIIGMQNESMISVFTYLLKFYTKQKIYLYKK